MHSMDVTTSRGVFGKNGKTRLTVLLVGKGAVVVEEDAPKRKGKVQASSACANLALARNMDWLSFPLL